MRLVLLTVVMVTVLFAANASALLPQEISYQGVLRDGAGELAPDGTYEICFVLYTVQNGGAPVWADTMNVAVEDGVFNVRLGSENHMQFVNFDSFLWLSMEVEGEPPLAPRTQLTAAPYAMMAIDAVPDIVSSIDGVTNDEGNIDLIEGTNITITPDDALNRITISASGGAGGDDDWEFSGDDIYRTDGNVGIGLVPSTAKLEIESTGDELVFMRTDYLPGGEGFGINMNNYGTVRLETTDPGNHIILGPGGPVALAAFGDTINPGSVGSVSIGTFDRPEPGYSLSVSRTTLLHALEIRDDAGQGKVLTSDENGLATWQDPPGADGPIVDVHDESSTTIIGSDWTQYDDSQVSLTVPGPGFIEVTSTVRVLVNHVEGTADLLSFGHSTSLTGNPLIAALQMIEIPAAVGTMYNWDHTMTISTMFEAPSAGTYTYYLVGMMGAGQEGQNRFWYAHTYGTYLPASAAAVAQSIAERDEMEARMQEK